MPINKKIADSVCKIDGHRIVALPIKQALVPPKMEMLTIDYEHLCEKCGLPLKDIRGMRHRTPPKSKNVGEEASSAAV